MSQMNKQATPKFYMNPGPDSSGDVKLPAEIVRPGIKSQELKTPSIKSTVKVETPKSSDNKKYRNIEFKPPNLPSSTADAQGISAYEHQLEVFHNKLVYDLRADSISRAWYCAPQWLQWYGEKATDVVLQNVTRHFKTARVYYLPHVVDKEEIVRLTAAIPAVCSTGDVGFRLISALTAPSPLKTSWQRSRTWDLKLQAEGKKIDNRKTANNLPMAINGCTDLLNVFERRRKRMTCIASSVDLFGRFGFGKGVQRYRPQTVRRDVIVVTAVGPQFRTSYLDYEDFVFSKDNSKSRLECFRRLGALPEDFEGALKAATEEGKSVTNWRFVVLPGERLFHKAGYLKSMKDSAFLWLRAFDDQVRRQQRGLKGYLLITAVGCGLFAKLPPWTADFASLSDILMGLLVQAIEEVLDENYFPDIIRVGFCDYSGKASFSPTKDYRRHVNTFALPKHDLCDFDNDDIQKYICGILNPGNAFSWPGNTAGYTSVEAEIGENTSMRIIQNWIHNRSLIDPRNHVAVDGPGQLAYGQHAEVKTPCIIADDNSIQDYTWDGTEMPIISGEIQREQST